VFWWLNNIDLESKETQKDEYIKFKKTGTFKKKEKNQKKNDRHTIAA